MNPRYLEAEAAKCFVARHPQLAWVDLLLFDLNGIARGKRIPARDLAAFAEKGVMLPASVFSMDSIGNCVEETGLLWETGDPDHLCRILADRLHLVPLDNGRRAQAVITMESAQDLDPLALLKHQMSRLAARGVTAVTAVEMEFYLSEPMSDEYPSPRIPRIIGGAADRPGLYGFDGLDVVQPIIDTIYAVAEGLDLPVDAIIKEAGPAQLEINLKHRPDAHEAALDALLLRRAVQQAVRAHDLDATFMAKPHEDWSGSGMHVHVSLVDQSGDNVLAGDPISQLFAHALDGLARTMPDFMAFWAQTANAYRRYVPNAYVPMTAQWGFNNRTVSLRLPAGPAQATRVEHRVAGADANPALVLAGVLAGLEQGIAAGNPIGPHADGNAALVPSPLLPIDWASALAVFAQSPAVEAAFGSHFRSVFTAIKHSERARFERVVGQLDHLWYARN